MPSETIMDLPVFPLTKTRDLPPLVHGDEGVYLGADYKGVGVAAWYALALQNSLDDAEELLEPRLPPEARPYVEVFERYLLDRAEHYMKQWDVDPPAPPQDDVTPE